MKMIIILKSRAIQTVTMVTGCVIVGEHYEASRKKEVCMQTDIEDCPMSDRDQCLLL